MVQRQRAPSCFSSCPHVPKAPKFHPPFASGMVDGYFDGDPPPAFWQCLAFYIGSNTLSSVYWAIDYGEEEIQVMLRQAGDVMDWYDGFQRVSPGWYSSL